MKFQIKDFGKDGLSEDMVADLKEFHNTNFKTCIVVGVIDNGDDDEELGIIPINCNVLQSMYLLHKAKENLTNAAKDALADILDFSNFPKKRGGGK